MQSQFYQHAPAFDRIASAIQDRPLAVKEIADATGFAEPTVRKELGAHRESIAKQPAGNGKPARYVLESTYSFPQSPEKTPTSPPWAILSFEFVAELRARLRAGEDWLAVYPSIMRRAGYFHPQTFWSAAFGYSWKDCPAEAYFPSEAIPFRDAGTK